MELIRKIVVLRDFITDRTRDKANISYYYPIDVLLEIMKDLMSVKTENESFNKEVLATAIFKIDTALEYRDNLDDDNLDVQDYRDKSFEIMKNNALTASRYFIEAVNRYQPTIAGEQIS